MSRPLYQLAQEALDVQDACNLCAVVQGFARAMLDLGTHTSGTDERNTHPVAVLWADKVAHLTGTQAPGIGGTVAEAYAKCRALARGVV